MELPSEIGEQFTPNTKRKEHKEEFVIFERTQQFSYEWAVNFLEETKKL